MSRINQEVTQKQKSAGFFPPVVYKIINREAAEDLTIASINYLDNKSTPTLRKSLDFSRGRRYLRSDLISYGHLLAYEITYVTPTASANVSAHLARNRVITIVRQT